MLGVDHRTLVGDSKTTYLPKGEAYRHAKITIAVVWIWSFFINFAVFFTVKADFDTRSCFWTDPKTGRAFFAVIEISMSSVLPFSLIAILYSHIYCKVRKIKKILKDKELGFKKRLTTLALAASLALIVGWFPTNISYMLRDTSVGGKHLGGAVFLVFVSLSLSNGFINSFYMEFTALSFEVNMEKYWVTQCAIWQNVRMKKKREKQK